MCRDTDLDGTCPLVHHLVDTDLEHFIGAQGSAAQDHAVVEVVSRAVKTASLACEYISVLKYCT